MSDSQAIVDREYEYRDAMIAGDLERLGALMEPEFYASLAVVGEGVHTFQRENFLAIVRDFHYDSLEIQNIQVRVFGNSAVSTLRWVQRATWGGANRDGDFTMTSIWAKRDSRWCMTSRHVSRPSPLLDDPPWDRYRIDGAAPRPDQ